jgi:hypothetical protein
VTLFAQSDAEFIAEVRAYAAAYLNGQWGFGALVRVHGVNADGSCTCGKQRCPDTGKHPTDSGWTVGVSDPAVVAHWWDDGRPYNLGLPCGDPSGVDCLDFDQHKGGDREFERWPLVTPDPETGEPGPDLPQSAWHATPGGGYHWLCRHVEGVRTRARLLPGTELKSDGTQVVLPPSRHASGRPYTWPPEVAPVADPGPVLPRLRGDLRGTKPERAERTPSDRSAVNDEVFPGPEAWLDQAGDVPNGGQREWLLSGIGWMRDRGRTQPECLALAVQVAGRFVTYDPGDPWSAKDVSDLVTDVFDRYTPTLDGDTVIPREFAASMREREVPERVQRLVHDALEQRQAAQLVAELELAEVQGQRSPRRSAREFAKVPQPEPVIEGVLAADVNLLDGPPEAGKSIVAQEWVFTVATGEPWRGLYQPAGGQVRSVVWVASEGLHDFEVRWVGHPLWERAADRVYVEDQPIDLVRGGDVDWFLDRYRDLGTAVAPKTVGVGLVVFDVIYGMGMADDNGTKDVLPVLTSMKRISAELHCATLALGHPPLTGDRRMRGSSNWRALAAVDWHLADGVLSCEKSKIADKHRLGATCRVEYPRVRWLSDTEALASLANRDALIRQDLELYPDESTSERARRLAPVLGLHVDSVRRLVRAVQRTEA